MASRPESLTNQKSQWLPRGLAGAVPGRWFLWLLALGAILPVLILRAESMAESDTFWETRTGLSILGSGTLPVVDSYSWTAAGRHWTLNSWGFDVLLGIAHLAAGLAGVALVGLLLGLAVFGSAFRLCRSASPVLAALVGLALCPLLVPWLAVRPQLVDYLGVLLLVLLAERLLAGPEWVEIAAVGVLFLVWTNLHAGSLLGVGVMVVLTVLTACLRHLRRRLGWLLVGATISLAGVLVNPYGWGIISQTVGVQHASAGLVAEWAPLDFTNSLQVAAVCAGSISLVAAVLEKRVVLAAALAVAVVGSMAAVRILPVLVVLSIPALADALSTTFVAGYVRSRGSIFKPAAVVVVCLIYAASITGISRFGTPVSQHYPVKLVAMIPSHCRLFNSYLVGGYVILVRPDVKVSIDSRNDLYGTDEVKAAQQTMAAKGEDDPGLRSVGCVLATRNSPLVRALSSSVRWRVLGETGTMSLLARK